MKIAIIGGTGREGAGLGIRWALAGHDIIIGSRDPERAKAKAAELRERTGKIPIVGETNREAAKERRPRRTQLYVAGRSDRANDADGPFGAACGVVQHPATSR